MSSMYCMYRKEQNAYGNLQPNVIGVAFTKDAAIDFMKKAAAKIVEEEGIPIRDDRNERIVLANVGNVIELYMKEIYMNPTGSPWLLDE